MKHIKIKYLLISALLFMIIGYAAINTVLDINGNVLIGKGNFRVYINNLTINGVDKNSLLSSDGNSFTFNLSDTSGIDNSSIEYQVKNDSADFDANVSLTCNPTSNADMSVKNETGDLFVEAGNTSNGTLRSNVKIKRYLYAQVKGESKGLDTTVGLNYDEISSSTNGQGVYETTKTDSNSSVYFYRGNVTNNNVIYAGYCWLMYRTTETGGVKIFYNGNPSGGKCSSPSGVGLKSITFNPAGNNNAYAGYMYGSTSASSYSAAHANTNDSNLKKEIDSWYESHILNTSNEKLLEDTVWCNDRSIVTDKSNWSSSASSYGTLGYGTNKTLYGFAVRGGSYAKVTNPTLNCANANDRFSKSASIGNGKLKYPIATITGDEIILAGVPGGHYNTTSEATSPLNTSYYLSNPNSHVWTMTPTLYNSYLQGTVLYQNGAISSYWTNVGTRSMGIRPSVSLNSSTYIASGDGSFNSPYIVEYDDGSSAIKCTLSVKAVEKNKEDDARFSLYAAVKNSSLGLDTDNSINYDAISSDSNGKGVYETVDTDSGKSVYFYRGDIDNNNVLFANNCWKIVRTTETMGVKLIYNGKPSSNGVCSNTGASTSIGESVWSEAHDDNAYVGYMYGSSGGSNYNDTHSNVNSSTVKKMIDKWYENNLKSTEYEDMLEDTTFCSDRSMLGDYSNLVSLGWLSYSQFGTLGYAKNNTIYTGTTRVGPLAKVTNPTLKCTINDNLSKTTELGTGSLMYPIGLITADEAVYAGATGGYNSKNDAAINESFYLWNGTKHFWTMTPHRYNSNNNIMLVVGSDGYISNEVVAISGGLYVRPSISLKGTVTIIEGNGTASKPYIITQTKSSSKVPTSWQDNGIFSAYYEQAYEKVSTMSLEEKIGQLMIVRYYSSTTPSDAVKNYYVSGTTFYGTDFSGKTEAQVKAMTSEVQNASKTPLITAVDEEGGKVVRISSNSNLAPEPFKSSRELYENGNQTFDLIIEDTVNKSALLRNLGLNMNFAPVVDIADETAYIYGRTLGYGTEKTGEYAVNVVKTSKNTGVSYSLKHFPGYGNNADTHTSSSTDETSLEELWNKHLVPFREGINAGAESVMISHNTVAAVDKENPASLSKAVHNILFNDLKFTGIAITDDLDMDGANVIENRYTKALLAGNNIMLLSNYQAAQQEIKTSIQNGLISEDAITRLAFKVIAWKYYKGLFN